MSKKFKKLVDIEPVVTDEEIIDETTYEEIEALEECVLEVPEIVIPSKVRVTGCDLLNVRKGPGYGFDIAAIYPKGMAIDIDEKFVHDEFYKIKGQFLFVAKAYCEVI